MEKKSDEFYSKQIFKPEVDLNVKPFFLGNVKQFAEKILDTEGVGYHRLTKVRHEYLNNETGEPAKRNTDSRKLNSDYTKYPDITGTINADGDQYMTELGKMALSLLTLVGEVHKENVDSGKSVDIDEYKKEIENEQKEAVEDES